MQITLKYSAQTDKVEDLTIKYFDTIPPCASLCIMKTGFLFAASEFGNHALYKFIGLGEGEDVEASSSTVRETEEGGFEPVFFEPRALENLEPVEEISSLAPVLDMKAGSVGEWGRWRGAWNRPIPMEKGPIWGAAARHCVLPSAAFFLDEPVALLSIWAGGQPPWGGDAPDLPQLRQGAPLHAAPASARHLGHRVGLRRPARAPRQRFHPSVLSAGQQRPVHGHLVREQHHGPGDQRGQCVAGHRFGASHRCPDAPCTAHGRRLDRPGPLQGHEARAA